MIHSYSKMKMFLDCPASLRMALDKVPEQTPEIINVGKLFHACAEAYGSHCITNGRRSDFTVTPKLMRSVVSNINDELSKHNQATCTLDQIEEAEGIAQEWAERTIFNHEWPTEFEVQYAIARDGAMRGFFDDDVFFRAVFDRIEFMPGAYDAMTIVDYKAGWKVDADQLQFDVYAWLAMSSNALLKRVTCIFEFVRFGVSKEQVYTRDDMPALDKKIRGILADIEGAEEFPHRPGPACGHCHRAHACTAKPAVIRAISTEEEAWQAVEALALLERDMKRIKAGLREYTDLFGPVSHNGVEWGTHAVESQGFADVTEFIKGCAEIGENPYAYLSVNNVKAKKLRKSLPHLLNIKRSTRFAGVKVGEEEE